MDEDLDASGGMDLLGLALGRMPGAADMDEFVHIEIFFDGTPAAFACGEAAPYLRLQICDIFELLANDLDTYLWHRDRFLLEVTLGENPGKDEPHLVGHIRTGDGAEDEWFVVYLLRRLTQARPGVSCRILDADGELLLIEAALAAPKWLEPSNAEHRCWLRDGKVHLLPRPRPPEPERLPCVDALRCLRSSRGATEAKEKVQRAIEVRIAGYPRTAVEQSKHVARAVLPVRVARAFIAYPQLVAVAVDHLPPASSREIGSKRRELRGTEAGVKLDCEGLSDVDMVTVGIRFTRCQYARLAGLRCQLPQQFSLKHWKAPRGSARVLEKSMRMGQMLCAGLETAFLQRSSASTAALRWPSPRYRDELLPTMAPWWLDTAFLRQAQEMAAPPQPTSEASRLAFTQQSEIDSDFGKMFTRAFGDSRLEAVVDLTEYWRDADDSEEWLEVSAEEIDREMAARQAEFDQYDRKRTDREGAPAAPASGAPEESCGGDGAAPGPEQAQAELAAMGQQLAGLLGRVSGAGGVRTGTTAAANSGAESDSNSDSGDDQLLTGDGEVDVLGNEDEEDDGSEDEAGDDADDVAAKDFPEYLAELDEQLEGVMDAAAPEETVSAGGESLPLHSHHVKVHSSEPLELDMHAMEHLLASFCSEHHLEPGPASLLLGELGLGGRAGATAGGTGGPSTGAVTADCSAPVASDCGGFVGLNDMD